MTDNRAALLAAVRTLAELPEVAAAVTQAGTRAVPARWHQALRRRIPENDAESQVRGARASAELRGRAIPGRSRA